MLLFQVLPEERFEVHLWGLHLGPGDAAVVTAMLRGAPGAKALLAKRGRAVCTTILRACGYLPPIEVRARLLGGI